MFDNSHILAGGKGLRRVVSRIFEQQRSCLRHASNRLIKSAYAKVGRPWVRFERSSITITSPKLWRFSAALRFIKNCIFVDPRQALI